MERKHLIWVRTYSGVLGFPPYEIAEFEMDYQKNVRPYVDIEDAYDSRWNYFNEYFAEELGSRTADGYSSLWYDGEAWEEYEEIMADLCRKKKNADRST